MSLLGRTSNFLSLILNTIRFWLLGFLTPSNTLKIKLLSSKAVIPSIQKEGSAGYDLHSSEDTVIQIGERKIVKTDIAMAIPSGYYGRVAPRSGLSVKDWIDVKAGVIDASYRGSVGVVLQNDHPKNPFVIKVGDRIAQILLEKIITPDVVIVDDLDATERGEGGYGSTGK